MAVTIDKETSLNNEIEASFKRNSALLDMPEKPEVPDSISGNTDLETGPPKELDWESPEDPGNARNWSKIKKILHTAIPALYGFVV